jgi:hypothetical protein
MSAVHIRRGTKKYFLYAFVSWIKFFCVFEGEKKLFLSSFLFSLFLKSMSQFKPTRQESKQKERKEKMFEMIPEEEREYKSYIRKYIFKKNIF